MARNDRAIAMGRRSYVANLALFAWHQAYIIVLLENRTDFRADSAFQSPDMENIVPKNGTDAKIGERGWVGRGSPTALDAGETAAPEHCKRLGPKALGLTGLERG